MSWGASALERRRQEMDALRNQQQSGGGPVDAMGIEKTAEKLTKAFSDTPSEPKAFNNSAQPSFVPEASQKPPIP
jgi:hypothetical protein